MKDLVIEDLHNLNECLKIVSHHKDITATIPPIAAIKKLVSTYAKDQAIFPCANEFLEELQKSRSLYLWANQQNEIIQHCEYNILQLKLERFLSCIQN